MKKKVAVGGGVGLPALTMRHPLWLGWKLLIVMSLVICIMAFLKLQSYSRQLHNPSSSSARSRFIYNYDFQGNVKVAFLFLTRKDLPLDFLWGSFFEVTLKLASNQQNTIITTIYNESRILIILCMRIFMFKFL